MSTAEALAIVDRQLGRIIDTVVVTWGGRRVDDASLSFLAIDRAITGRAHRHVGLIVADWSGAEPYALELWSVAGPALAGYREAAEGGFFYVRRGESS